MQYTILEDVVNGNQHGMSHGNICALLAPVGTDTQKLRRKIAVFVFYCRVCTYNQRIPQKGIPLPDFLGLPFMGAFVIPGTKPCP